MPSVVLRLSALLLALAAGAAAPARDAATAADHGAPASAALTGERTSTYANLQGEVVLENARVRVEKFVILPGTSTGLHTHPADQLLVFVKGGVLTAASGRSTLWRDGRVEWQSARAAADPGSTNTGPAPIEIICVNLKPVATHAAAGPEGQPKYRYLNYPNIPGEDLLENEFVIVQRFTVNPGQWEGVHAHHPDMLYIHIKGGQWAARSKTEAEHPYPEPSPDGEVGWMPTIPLSVGHESRNVGPEPIDLIWVTLKK
jgi:quercetin dioxygenase-like cupin family protein